MKRFSIILFGALAMLMASCSKNIEPSPSDPNAWYIDIHLPVPIEFGSSVVSTKAAENNPHFVDNLEEKLVFGVYAVNKDADTLKFLLNNKYGRCQNKNFTWGDGDTPYYPMTNECYSFYAYYEQVDRSLEDNPSPITKTGKSVSVKLKVAYDILYGKAEATPIKDGELLRYGFNGAYIRAGRNNNLPDYLPKFQFEHVTAALQFYVKADESSTFEADDTWIHEIKLEKIPTSADLCIVSVDNNASEGTLSVPEAYSENSSYYGDKNVYLRTTKDKFYPKYTTEKLGQKAGAPEFIVPTSSDISGKIVLKDKKTGTETTTELPFTIRVKDLGINKFEAGYRYNLNLKLHTPEKVDISVDVEKWKDGFTYGEYDPDEPGFGDIDTGQ